MQNENALTIEGHIERLRSFEIGHRRCAILDLSANGRKYSVNGIGCRKTDPKVFDMPKGTVRVTGTVGYLEYTDTVGERKKIEQVNAAEITVTGLTRRKHRKS